MTASTVDLNFEFENAQIVSVNVTGFERGVTAIRALAHAGNPETLEQIAQSVALRSAADQGLDIVVEMTHSGDRALVTATGFTDPIFGLYALEEAGSEETFLHLLNALTDQGDMSLLELMDKADD